uniref:Patched-like protein n=1 Tax=Schmidtea mediterranea TaxID=79327 RepID=D2ILS0_SCHMD|nr:patched-like protein [Schmidtea mediterranea]
MVNMYIKGHSSLKCKTNIKIWLKLKYFCYQKFVRYHHWKILLIGIGFLGLCLLGFKSVQFETDVMNLWIYNSSRLHNETSFISRVSGSKIESGSIETILQVSTHNNLLSTEFLLEHLQLLQNVVNVTLQYDRRSFTFSDFCQRVQLPKLHYLHDRSLRVSVENLMPCRIISPLNCFWEGSKLLDHYSKNKFSNYDESRSIKIDWKSFNISQEFFYSFKETSNYNFFYELFKEAGIRSGFISKPCLDVTDASCPNRLKQKPSYESIVNEGCAQIGEHMDKYSKSIFIGKDNRGLQTFLLLQSTSHVLETMKINNLEWPESKIQDVMNLWLQKLQQTVIHFNSHRPYLESIPYRNAKFQSQRIRKSSFYVFTNNSLNSALNQANKDETLLAKYLTSGGVVMLFVVLIFVSSDNLVRSHCWLAVTSTSLLIAAILSGLGLMAAIGFTFNTLTTQVVPFVMVGLGLEEVIILTKKYSKNIDICRQKINHPHPVAQTLYDCATILMVSFSIKLIVLSALTMIPVPLMRNFCIQILFIMLLQTGVNAFLYPCLLHLDSVRRESNRIDLLCCLLKRQTPNDSTESYSAVPRQYDCVRKDSNLLKSKIIFSTEFTTAPDTFIPNNVHQYCEINPVDLSPRSEPSTSRSFPLNSSVDNNLEPKPLKNKRHRCCWKFHYRLSKTFLHIIVLVPVQITVILVTLLIIVMGLYSAVNIDCGLLFESIFPRDSNEFHYIKYETELFRFQNFEIVTKEFEYTNNQDILLQLHQEIDNLHHVALLENGKFWLSSFIGWLERIQSDFDRDVKNKLILANGTWSRNASKNGLLVMTLMVQDGESINYKKLSTSRLVRNGKVDERKFYLFLNVWRSMSVEYETQPCLLYPKIEPFTVDNFIPSKYRKEPSVIRMSGLNLFSNHPLQFVACKYFHKGQSSQEELDFVKTVRSITSRYTNNLSLPTIPIGNIFTLSEQYLKLRYQLVIVSIILAIGMFVISLLAINHFLASILATLLLSSSILSPMLFMNLYQIPLNATSGVMALWSGGLGFRFSLFLIVSYVEQTEPSSTEAQPDMELGVSPSSGDTGNERTREPVAKDCIGSIFSVTFMVNKQKLIRVERAFNDVPCGKAVFSTFLGMAFIIMTDISFLWRNFMLIPFVGLVHSLLNYYYLAPIFCFYLIPKSDHKTRSPFVRNSDSYRCKSRPSHKSSTKSFRSQVSRNGSKFDLTNDNSAHGKLSIIPEESSSVQSSLKSKDCRDNDHINNSSSSSDSSSSSSSSSSDSSQSQENDSRFVRQNVESSLIIHYSIDGQGKSPKKDANFPPELAVKTSFKYRQPTGQDQQDGH